MIRRLRIFKTSLISYENAAVTLFFFSSRSSWSQVVGDKAHSQTPVEDPRELGLDVVSYDWGKQSQDKTFSSLLLPSVPLIPEGLRLPGGWVVILGPSRNDF